LLKIHHVNKKKLTSSLPTLITLQSFQRTIFCKKWCKDREKIIPSKLSFTFFSHTSKLFKEQIHQKWTANIHFMVDSTKPAHEEICIFFLIGSFSV